MPRKTLEGLRGMTDAILTKIRQRGINTITGLKNAVRNKDVAVPKIMEYDLQYNISRNIPRAKITQILSYFTKQEMQSMTPVGSYRRGAMFSKDIDLLIQSAPLTKGADIGAHSTKGADIGAPLRTLAKRGFDVKIYTNGEKRKSAIIKPPGEVVYYMLDLFSTQKDDMAFALLHHTGNMMLNIKMRLKAKNMGFKLNQYGLFKMPISKLGKKYKHSHSYGCFFNDR